MWIEFVMALVVEAYREFVEWWQTKAFWRNPDDARPHEAEAAASADERQVRVWRAIDSSEVEARVNALLEQHTRKHVGVAVGVCRGGETRTFARGVAKAGRPERPSAATIFEIGSVTKVLTATLLAQMVQDGAVALDEPVQNELPEGVRLPVRGRQITFGDLATHTSGLPRLPKGLFRLSLAQRRNPYANFTEAHLARAITEARLRGDPGTRIRYSNFGFGLLGYVLARRAGTTFEQLVRERLCEPLGLADTWITVPIATSQRFADGHDRRGRVVPHWDLPALAGAGAFRSTVADLLRFLDLQLGLPTTPLERAAQLTQEPRAHRGRLAQGLGWACLPLRSTTLRVLWHNGGTGGFRSFVGFVKETQTGVVVLSNCARSVDALGFRMLEALAPP